MVGKKRLKKILKEKLKNKNKIKLYMKATSVFKHKNISRKNSKKSVIKHSIKQSEKAEEAELSKHIGSKTIKIKDISAITPIPTAIKIKEPEPIQTVKECSQFHYPLNDILNTNFEELKTKLFSKLLICPYFITTCQNRSNIMKPYLQYLLYKYPQSNSKISNLMVFPFKDLNKKVDIEKQANILLDEVIKVKIKSDGYLIKNNNVYVFFNLSQVDEFSREPRAAQQWLKLIKKEYQLWWVLIDEICNHKKSLNFPIHDSVSNLFLNNPTMIYLKNNQKNIEIPVVAYFGNYYKFLPIIVTLGQKPTTLPNGDFGAYFYFTDYVGAFRNAGWTTNYQQRKVYGKEIADENGKLLQGGIVRFALFLGKTLALLDQKDTKVTDYIYKEKATWTNDYDSLYLGRIPRINESVWKINPTFVVKKYQQQIPLSMHLVDMSSLKPTWDPLYDGYKIQ